MRTPLKSGRARPVRDRLVASLLAGLAVPACDTFFGIHGRVTDCVANSPLAAVAIDVQVVSGLGGRRQSLPNHAMTNVRGEYAFDVNEPSSTAATLTFHRDGYAPFTTAQFNGHDISDPPYDLCLAPPPSP